MGTERGHRFGRREALIDDFVFGRIVIDGQPYTQDVVIYPDRVQEGWVRKAGHKLEPDDLEGVLEQDARTLVVGTGATGLMRVPRETLEYLESNGFEVIVQPTAEACETYNQLAELGPVIAALHLGC
jgi:hypothetical protein